MEERSRAAFVPSSDPFVLLQFYYYFKTVWYDEVDRLYVFFSSDLSAAITDELATILQDEKVRLINFKSVTPHGESIKQFLRVCSEKHVVLLEDDFLIFHPGIVDEYFCMIEDGGAGLVASERMSCHPDTAKLAQILWGLDYYKAGDCGCSFWPCFIFAKREFLLECSEYGATHFGDTFVFASLVLRHRFGNNIFTVPQYHLSPTDPLLKEYGQSIFDGNCDYLHIGSLSSGMENTLVDAEDIPLQFFGKDSNKSLFVPPTTDAERLELERRVIFWRKAYELNNGANFGSFGQEYGRAIQRVIERCQLDTERMAATQNMYEEVMSD